jgi:hypothetical protein
MRTFLTIVFLVFFFGVYSQSKKEIKVVKAKIADMKTLREIITDIPKNCKVSSFVFSTFAGGSLKEYMVIGEAISPQMRHILNSLGKGMIFNITEISSDCPVSHKESYKVTLE